MNKLGYLLLLLIVTAITATSSWLLNKVDQKPLGIIEPPRHDPDYFMTNFSASVMGIDGNIKYKMQAQRLDHYPDDDSVSVDRPHVEYFRPQLSNWILDAAHGEIYNKGNLIILNGKVVMVREKSKTEPYLKLVTRDLTIKTDIEYAETDAEVYLESEQNRLNATGMRLHLAQGKLELRNNVTGKYDVKK